MALLKSIKVKFSTKFVNPLLISSRAFIDMHSQCIYILFCDWCYGKKYSYYYTVYNLWRIYCMCSGFLCCAITKYTRIYTIMSISQNERRTHCSMFTYITNANTTCNYFITNNMLHNNVCRLHTYDEHIIHYLSELV